MDSKAQNSLFWVIFKRSLLIAKLAHGTFSARQSELREFRNQNTVRNSGGRKEQMVSCTATIRGSLFTPIFIPFRSHSSKKEPGLCGLGSMPTLDYRDEDGGILSYPHHQETWQKEQMFTT